MANVTTFPIRFVKQKNGYDNSTTYITDKYIHLYYEGSNNTFGDTFVYSSEKIKISDYSRLVVTFKLVKDHPSSDTYRFRIGLDTTQTDQASINYHTWYSPTFSVSEEQQTYTLDFTSLSLSGSYYIRVGGVQDVYIYSMELYSKSSEYIDITQLPTKLDYNSGGKIDITGLIVHHYDSNGNDLGVINNSLLTITCDGGTHTGFTARSDSIVSTADTVLSSWSGGRSPFKKTNNGEAACMLAKNGAYDPSYGGNWCGALSFSDTEAKTHINSPDYRAGTSSYIHKINNINYCVGYLWSNANWGGATLANFTNPQDLPTTTNVYVHRTNNGSTNEQIKHCLRFLNFKWIGGAVTITYNGMFTQYGITGNPDPSGDYSGNVYIGNNSNSPYKVINIFVNRLNKSKIAKGWVGVGNQPKQFWPPRMDAGNIFSNGEFVGCPTGTSMNNYALSTDASAYRTNKCLFAKNQNNAQEWYLEDGYIRKGATVTLNTSSGWFIPVGRRYGVSKIKVLTKWIATAATSYNLWNFGVAFVDNTNTINVTYKFSGDGSSTRYSDWTEDEYDFSSHNLEYIDYVYVWGCDGSPGFKSITLE